MRYLKLMLPLIGQSLLWRTIQLLSLMWRRVGFHKQSKLQLVVECQLVLSPFTTTTITHTCCFKGSSLFSCGPCVLHLLVKCNQILEGILKFSLCPFLKPFFIILFYAGAYREKGLAVKWGSIQAEKLMLTGYT